jgi:antitoxin (DNA-binding transcriptional repressor) of toxin-antitoxin stability system
MEAGVEVGIRKLRDGLSRHLAEVRAGHTIHITDHGRVIAKIVPVGVPTTLERLRAEGRITPSSRPRRSASPEPVEASGTVSDLIGDQRR